MNHPEFDPRVVWNENLLRAIRHGITWPRYIRCDGAECPIGWEHWHFVNEDGTAAGTDWLALL